MSTKAYITKTSLSYRVIVFSFIQDEPIEISPFVIRVNGSKSVVNSQDDTFSVTIKVPAVSLLFQVGDWVQIDLETPTEKPEHIFFGQIMDLYGDETVASGGGGIMENAILRAVSWGSVFRRYIRDLRTYMRVNADTLFPWRDKKIESGLVQETSGKPKLTGLQEPDFDTPPSLATIAQGKLKAHPWQAVAMTLHHLCVYGGTLGQQFWLPKSFTGLTELVPLIEYVGRINKLRLPKNRVLDEFYSGFDADTDNLIKEIEKRDFSDDLAALGLAATVGFPQPGEIGGELENVRYKTQVPKDDRSWQYSDWHQTFATNKAFVPGSGFLRDFLTFDLQTTLSDLAADLSDPAFNELFYTLQERCNLGPVNPNEAVIPGTGERIPFSRDYIPTIVLRPIPHPTWNSRKNTTIARSMSEQIMFTADARNYEKTCTKFVLGLGHTRGARFRQSISNAFTYFNVVPQDQELQAFEEFDAAAMIRYSSGRIPLIDEELMQTFGHLPMVPKTRYYIGGESYYVAPTTGAEPFVKVDSELELPNPTGPGTVRFRKDENPSWMILASKALALYSWHVRGWEHYDGSFSMPIVDVNVPRPGDVGYLVSHESDSGSHFRNANRRFFEPKIIAKQLSTGAISIYVDSVSYDLVMNPQTSMVQGNITINFSHGVWCETTRPNSSALPYKRFVEYSEVGISPTYFLPPAHGSVSMRDEIFNEFAQVVVVSAKDLVANVEGEKDSSRNKKRRKRGRRRRAKHGLRKTAVKKGNTTQGGMSFSLVSYKEFEQEAETKKTRRNPTKKVVGEKWVNVKTEIEVTVRPGIVDILTTGAIFGLEKAITGEKKKVPIVVPVKTNKYGEVTPEAMEKAKVSYILGEKKGPIPGVD